MISQKVESIGREEAIDPRWIMGMNKRRILKEWFAGEVNSEEVLMVIMLSLIHI